MNIYDIIIVGGGPAGLTAALYASRAGKKVLVLEQKAVGGQIITSEKIKNYPAIPEISGADFAKKLKLQVKNFGGLIKLEKAVKITKKAEIFLVATDLSNTYQAAAVIIATGSAPKSLGAKRESDFLGRGISYCATCDGHFYKGKTVAIVGGGNTALYDALHLSDLAQKVYLIHRRNTFRGDVALVKMLESKPNVEFILPAKITELLGENKLSGLKVQTTNASAPLLLNVDALFVAVGYAPQNTDFADAVELDSEGYIKTSDGVHTSAAKIYVAGDARKKDLKQLVTAAADGAIAATIAIKDN